MARVKIDLPDSFPFQTFIHLRVNDMNYGNHLSNDKVITLAHEARVRFLASLGYKELDVEGHSIIQGDTAAVYKSEGFYGDEIRIEVAVGDVGSSSFDIYYRMTNLTTGKPLAHVKTGMLFFDYEKRRPLPVPDVFRERVS